MTSQSRKSYLIFLRDQITSLCIVKCRMAHERVVGSADSIQPAVNRGLFPSFKRIGLCNPDERAERLGCSHTMSRSKLDRAISELESKKAECLSYELNWLTNEIHLLDHRKGEAEARLAVAKWDARGGCGEVKGLELVKESEEVKRLERQHDEYVERVGLLRDRVVIEIDKMIDKL